MMRQHKKWRVIRRLLAPPSLPRVIGPRSANRSKHVTTENPCTDIFKRLQTKIVVHASPFVTRTDQVRMTRHLVEHFRMKEPGVQFSPAHTQRIANILTRSGAESI